MSAFLRRFAIMAALWVVLAGADPRGWPLAGLIIATAAYVSLRTLPPGRYRISLAGLVRFVPFFLFHSARGGIDVASRAIRPRPDLAPGFVRFRSSLPPNGARSFYLAVIGLLPGTLTARDEGDLIHVHTLDRRRDLIPQLRALELRVADLFGSPATAPRE